MAIDKGNIKTSANYDVKAQKPLDGRAVRPAKADLIKKESWSSDGNTVYVYEGMQVYVQDEKKTYYLKDLSKMFATDFSGWELMGTGAGSGITEEKEVYIGSEEPPKGTKVWIDPTGTPSQPSQPSAGVEVIDNLESDSTTAALSANQGRVLKEMIDELSSGGGGNAAGAKAYVIPEGVFGGTEDSPYILTDDEVKDFVEQGDFLSSVIWVKRIGSTSTGYTQVREMWRDAFGAITMYTFRAIYIQYIMPNPPVISNVELSLCEVNIANNNGVYMAIASVKPFGLSN